jgi:hypothetical protein
MPRIFRYLSAIFIISLLFPLMSCKKKEAPVEKAGRVSATRAYEQYFGPAPTVAEGTCFAFVIYFPSVKEPGKVLPFPFFTFDEESMKKVALERLLGGMDVGSFKGEIARPFPAGTRILEVSDEKGTVTVNFGKELLASKAGEEERAAFKAVVQTLFQFDGVKRVSFQVEGKWSGMVDGKDVSALLARQPSRPDEASVMQPSPPRLLSVTGVKDKGAKSIEDIHVYFDRPVDIKDISLSDRNGKPFSGEMYQSVFDMAAVFKPKDIAAFKAGTQIRVRWHVVDKLGRAASGEQEMQLEIKEH